MENIHGRGVYIRRQDWRDVPEGNFIEEQEEEKDIVICLNCGHLAHYHQDKQTKETTDTCRRPDCDCQSFSPEICN